MMTWPKSPAAMRICYHKLNLNKPFNWFPDILIRSSPSKVTFRTKHTVNGWICFSHSLATCLHLLLCLSPSLEKLDLLIQNRQTIFLWRNKYMYLSLSLSVRHIWTKHWRYCLVGFPALMLQEAATEEQSTKMFVVIIWINSWRYQVQRHQCHPGKVMPLCPLFTSRKEAL